MVVDFIFDLFQLKLFWLGVMHYSMPEYVFYPELLRWILLEIFFSVFLAVFHVRCCAGKWLFVPLQFCKNNWVGVTAPMSMSAGLWLVNVTPLWWVDEFLSMWGWAGTTGCLNLTLGQLTVNWPRGKKWVAFYWWKNQSVSWFMKHIPSEQRCPVLSHYSAWRYCGP